MTIKELERQTGLPRTTIRFYEQEGLIAPSAGRTTIVTTRRRMRRLWRRSSCCGS